MRHITYLIILNLLFLNVYNAESQTTKKPVFTKATYEPLKVTQTTKVCDPESITLSAAATNYCKLSKILNFAYQIDYNNDGSFEASGTGNQAILGNHSAYKFGTHKIKWLVTDGCGGLSTCSKLVTIEKAISSKKPTPIAKLLSIELMPNNCTAVLEATKVNNFSYDDCTAAKDLRYRLAKFGDYHSNMTFKEVLALNEYISFTSTDGTFLIALFVIDEDDNWDYVETFIVVQSNMNPDCVVAEPKEITGSIRTSKNDIFYDSNTIVNYRYSNMGNDSMKLDQNGNYRFPTKSTFVFQLLSTFVTVQSTSKLKKEIPKINISILRDFLDNKITITNPYARIAADLNSDGKIDNEDLAELELILDDSKPDYFSKYKFLLGVYQFKTQFPESEAYLTETLSSFFVSIKINPTFIAIIPGDIYSNLFYQPIDRSSVENNSIQLFQNQPNPFSNSTSIPFVLPSQQEVRFDFYDVNGSLIKSMNQDYSAGYHQLTIDANEFTTTGMIYYQMITKDNIQTKNMLLIKK